MRVVVSVAGGGSGGGRSCVWLSACVSTGFSWAQFARVRVEAFILKALFFKKIWQ